MSRVHAPMPLCHGRKHVSLSVTPDAIEKALITFDRERPRVMVYTVRRIYGGVDQTTDGLPIDSLCREFTRRAATRDCLIGVHYVLVLRGSSGVGWGGSGLRPHILFADSRLLCSASHKGSNEFPYNMERLTCWRAVERSGDAAVVPPYRAQRRYVLIVRVLRAPAFDTCGETMVEQTCAGSPAKYCEKLESWGAAYFTPIIRTRDISEQSVHSQTDIERIARCGHGDSIR